MEKLLSEMYQSPNLELHPTPKNLSMDGLKLLETAINSCIQTGNVNNMNVPLGILQGVFRSVFERGFVTEEDKIEIESNHLYRFGDKNQNLKQAISIILNSNKDQFSM